MALEHSMKHLNWNALCGIWIETTGKDGRQCDIIDICITLADNFIRPSKQTMPYYNEIAPFRPETIDYETASVSKERIRHAGTHGLEPSLAADRLEEWLAHLDLPRGKKIVPLTYNWPAMREYLITWLGPLTFDSIFALEYRDIMSTTLFVNDMSNQRAQAIPYPRPEHMPYICAHYGIEFKAADDVQIKCLKTIEVYQKLLGVRV